MRLCVTCSFENSIRTLWCLSKVNLVVPVILYSRIRIQVSSFGICNRVCLTPGLYSLLKFKSQHLEVCQISNDYLITWHLCDDFQIYHCISCILLHNTPPQGSVASKINDWLFLIFCGLSGQWASSPELAHKAPGSCQLRWCWKL